MHDSVLRSWLVSMLWSGFGLLCMNFKLHGFSLVATGPLNYQQVAHCILGMHFMPLHGNFEQNHDWWWKHVLNGSGKFWNKNLKHWIWGKSWTWIWQNAHRKFKRRSIFQIHKIHLFKKAFSRVKVAHPQNCISNPTVMFLFPLSRANKEASSKHPLDNGWDTHEKTTYLPGLKNCIPNPTQMWSLFPLPRDGWHSIIRTLICKDRTCKIQN
jgi:hypothetical protein